MAATYRTPAQIELDRAEVARLARIGWSSTDIAKQQNRTRQMVDYDLKKVKALWRQAAQADIKAWTGLLIEDLMDAKREYRDAWERSKAGKETLTESESNDGGEKIAGVNLRNGAVDVAPAKVSTSKSRKFEPSNGDTAYLNGVVACIDRICKILGIDAAKKLDINIRREAEKVAAELGVSVEELMNEAESIAEQAWAEGTSAEAEGQEEEIVDSLA